MSVTAPPAFLQTIADGWLWTPQPARLAYQLEHPCGLTFDMPAGFAEAATAEDARIISGAMAASVNFELTHTFPAES